ncbi:carboxypeptidase-like regulatory domain-containing protein [Bizionia argentinensis JUB59]|uniref:Carboxypeptidase-like regulatory domain-containing protein n=1 Tax=Bizionia argentinensis JUB59 TaxID=1046627 RepID=G2EHP9_9FLAO|nr:carboxypeptidase-like regulatory domain-containing protein [Bizionia argentinensis]EGV42027.1 carboxypeptidase-like regulatory domain-containing protein [Bizionia argentinensis JUB59]
MLFKNIKQTLFSVLIFVCSLSSLSQTIRGKILDTHNIPIPFATIQIGDDYGVISNDEGNFTIHTSSFQDKDSVHISCMGYEKIGFQVQEFQSKNYTLTDHVNELSEVYVTDRKLSIDSILYYVNANVSKNYRLNNHSFKLFGRRTEYVAGKVAEFEITKSPNFKKKQLEAFNKDFEDLGKSLLNNNSKQYTDMVSTLYIKDAKHAKLEVEKAVRLLDERNDQSLEKMVEKGNDIVLKHLDTSKVYTVKSGWFKVSDSVSFNKRNDKVSDSINAIRFIREAALNMVKEVNPITEDLELDFITNTRKYDYELKDFTYLNDEIVYIIDFKPKRGSANYEGTMYVSNQTFAVLRADYAFYPGREGKKFNLRLILGVKYVEKNKAGSVAYKKDSDGYYYPYYIKNEVDRYFYINRPIKFIDNDDRSNKVAFNFKMEGTFKERTEMLTLDVNIMDEAIFNAVTEPKTLDYETKKKYDPAIWKNYNVIEPLQEMKDFKVKN